MSFVTIPDEKNAPVLINTKCIEYVSYKDFDTLQINFTGGGKIITKMQRPMLVDILCRKEREPEPVQPTTEFAG